MLLAFGVVCGLLEAQRSGAGQVIDAAMVDGAAVLMTMIWTLHNAGLLRHQHGAAPTCSTPAPTSTTCTSAPTASTSRSDRSSRSSTPSCCGSPGSTGDERVRRAARPLPPGPTLKARLGRAVPHQDPRRVVRGDGAHRRVLRARAAPRRGRRASAQRRPGDVRRRLRRAATGACAALQPHRARAVAPAGARRPAHARGARRLGHRRRARSTPCSPVRRGAGRR